ncbi:hypothetical protein R3P38DRAFT_3194805 [Favolaschia claudopus]|uniref:Uncharacterized protein n=1 Tax=Favolaschia claudopus TaxID=2862362 RepID=A0AAW0BCH7_9AGAR
MSKAMKKYRALDFLDLAAVDDSDSEEEHELNDSMPSLRALCLTESNDLPVFTRAAYIDDDEDTHPEQAARDIEERYRARYSGDSEARIGDTEIGHSIFEWAHTMERIEGSFKVPVWDDQSHRTRGRELDVVGTILKICSIHTGENVLSATAPPSAPVSCTSSATMKALYATYNEKWPSFAATSLPATQKLRYRFARALDALTA